MLLAVIVERREGIERNGPKKRNNNRSVSGKCWYSGSGRRQQKLLYLWLLLYFLRLDPRRVVAVVLCVTRIDCDDCCGCGVAAETKRESRSGVGGDDGIVEVVVSVVTVVFVAVHSCFLHCQRVTLAAIERAIQRMA